MDAEKIYNQYMEYAEIMKPYVAETAYLVNKLYDEGKKKL